MFVDPEYRVMYAVGVEGASGRGDIAAREAREALFRILRETLAATGVHWDACHRDDLGDRMRLVLPSGIPRAALLYPFTYELAVRLEAYNRRPGGLVRVRARAALHAGDVHMTDGRMVGRSLQALARLLDATPLRSAFTAAAERTALALLMSQHMYDETVRCGGPDVDADEFRRVRVTADGATTDAWLHVPRVPVGAAAAHRVRQESDASAVSGAGRRAGRWSDEQIRQGG